MREAECRRQKEECGRQEWLAEFVVPNKHAQRFHGAPESKGFGFYMNKGMFTGCLQ